MSKRRDLRHRSNAYINNMSVDETKLRNSSFFGAETTKSKYIPNSHYNRNFSENEPNLQDFKKEKLYNRYSFAKAGTFRFSDKHLTKMILANFLSCLPFGLVNPSSLVSKHLNNLV